MSQQSSGLERAAAERGAVAAAVRGWRGAAGHRHASHHARDRRGAGRARGEARQTCKLCLMVFGTESAIGRVYSC